MYVYTDPETGMNVLMSWIQGDGAKERYLKPTGKKEKDLVVNLLETFRAFEEMAKSSKHGNARPAT